MNLLVIVLCLLSERFLIHSLSHKRVVWMQAYLALFTKGAAHLPLLQNSLLFVLSYALVPGIAVFIMLAVFGGWLFGLFGLVIHLVVVYYCLGPENVFYSLRSESNKPSHYLETANSKIIAVIFWYFIAGPFAAIFYRMVSFIASGHSQGDNKTIAAKKIQSLLDWIPARITAILYLLAGNYQSGLANVKADFLGGVTSNGKLLRQAGLSAASIKDDVGNFTAAEKLVEHAIVIYLSFIAFLTLIIALINY